MRKNDYCIIMSGGIGSRFWPVSRTKKPKQFLDLFGTGRTLLQATVERINPLIPIENIIIVTNAHYLEETKRQLPMMSEENILLEPVRRNTAPAIAYATSKIRQRCADATMFVCPSDHIILHEERFTEIARKSLDFAHRHDYLLTLGITPSRPEVGYGYIQWREETIEGFHKVKVFTEKPNTEMATLFLESGDFLWNSGMFIWNVHTISHALHTFTPELYEAFSPERIPYDTTEEQAAIEAAFTTCQSISIDYAIMEKAPNVLVLPADFGWADLGTWTSVYEVAAKSDAAANATNSPCCFFHEAERNIVSLSTPNKIAVIQGIDDCIIADHQNVLLICKKDQEDRIKSFMTEVELKYGEEYI